MQNIANLVLFGEKEPYMMVLNEYVTKSTQRMTTLIDEISETKSKNFRTHANIDDGLLPMQLALLHRTLYNSLLKIAESGSDSGLLVIRLMLQNIHEKGMNAK
jgi:hypothetical protein